MIRISGEDAHAVAERIFRTKSSRAISEYPYGRAIYGEVVFGGEVIDDCVIILYKAPFSYTGEDTVEIFCHGGILVTEEVMKCTLSAGARAAEAGEFTKRAFVNGKLSLTEAEAVINTIDAKTTEALRLARSHKNGVLKTETDRLYSMLLDVASSIYAVIDYPDEDLADMSNEEIRDALTEVKLSLERLISTYRTGKAVIEGIYTAIIGKPNTGKSALLNMLLKEERAIVSSTEGTTRDRIEEDAILGRVRIRLADTAGIRASDDEIEQIGIERSLEAAKKAELILAVFDSSTPMTSEDEEIIALLNSIDAPKIAVMNKSDLPSVWEVNGNFEKTVYVSAKERVGTDALTLAVEELFINDKISYDRDAVLVNARQRASIESALSSVISAISALDDGLPADASAYDVEAAMTALGECDGRAVSEDITSAIFSRFCVGK